jgi:ATP-dependent helicase/nuclease subunit B
VTETKYPDPTATPIADIAKNHPPGVLRAFNYGPDHPAMALWVHPQTGLLGRLATELQRRGAHAARTVVLLPYAQLLPLATRLWTQTFPDGFAPRFETTMNWSAALGGHDRQTTDLTLDAGLDHLTAQSFLAQAGLAQQQDALAGLLVQAAHQLAPLAAAVGPDQRAQWAREARVAATTGMEGSALQWEAAVARIAVEWAAVSGYASDVLFAPQRQAELDCLVLVQGLAPDAFTAGLANAWGDKLVVLPLAAMAGEQSSQPSQGQIALHACGDAEDEAQRSAACALQHIAAGRFPVALVSSDRALTRRVRAMLDGAGVAMRDENGWKLSTSRAAATVMALLRAATWNATTDAVLAWLKDSPVFAPSVDALEVALRRDQVRDWRHAPVALRTPIDAVLSACKGQRTLHAWLVVLRSALQEAGQWDGMLADAVGAEVLSSLQLQPRDSAQWSHWSVDAPWAQRRLDLNDFTRWVNQVLEGASFKPAYPAEEQVVILPMSQMLGRPFAAVVLAGCDEVRLNPNAEPAGAWTAAQRAALGMPSRDALCAAVHAAWQYSLQTPVCDVLWRTGDEAGETLLPCTLVQLLQSSSGNSGGPSVGVDPRTDRPIAPLPQTPPQANGSAVPVRYLSASAYEDLRQCPYRFFAMRQLALKSVDELESEVDKRDFGLWLHAVLSHFHAALQEQPVASLDARITRLDASAHATTESMALPEGEFLPFMAAWPAVRDKYLKWLAEHEAEGAVFASGETSHQQRVGDIQLLGRIDRVDNLPDGSVMVLDYKTEPSAKTTARVKDPMEDTQIAFYAALLPHDTLRGGYVNVGERDGTVLREQKHLVQARDALIEGIGIDMQRVRDGIPLQALGDGPACDFCQARGMCRKDFWND